MGVMLDEVGEAYTYSDLADWLERLALEFGTHTHAALNNWAYPLTYGELIAIQHFETWRNIRFEDPIRVPRPWERSANVPTFTPDETALAVERLSRRSAFRDRA